MNRIKKIVSFALVLCFCVAFSLQSFAEQATVEKPLVNFDEVVSASATIAAEAKFDAVLRMPIGSGEGEVGYSYDDDGTAYGPQDFMIREDGAVCVLDTINDRILVFENGAYSHDVDLSVVTNDLWAQFFAYWNGMFFVTHMFGDYVIAVDENAPQNAFKVPLPAGQIAGSIFEISVEGDYLLMSGIAGDRMEKTYTYILPLGDVENATADSYIRTEYKEPVQAAADNKTALTYRDSKMTIAADPTNGISVIGKSGNGNVYIDYYDRVKNTSSLRSERTIRAYDKNGKVLGYARIDTDDWAAFPLKTTRVSDNGHVFLLNCTEDKVEIQHVTLGKTFHSKMSEITAEVRKLEKAAELVESLTADTRIYADPSLTREEMLQTAYAMATYVWQVVPGNKIAKYGIIIPPHISDADPGTKIMGVPYSFGGFDTLVDFKLKQAGGRPTGNISDISNADTKQYVGGIDCSGLASRAYGLTNKLNTKGLFEKFGTKITNNANLENAYKLSQMDLLLRYGVGGYANHAMLFGRVIGNDLLVIDATRGSGINRVSARYVTSDYASTFWAYSPYK